MSEQPAEPAGSEPTTMPDPDEGPEPLDPDMPTGPGDVGSGDVDLDGVGDRPGSTPAGAADTASIGTPDESDSTTE